MLAVFMRNWWVLALQGALAVVFGVLALVWPGVTLLTLVLLFGAYVLVNGVLTLVRGLASMASQGRRGRWWAVLLQGVAGIVIGLVVLFWPRATTLALLYLIAAWAVVTGIFEVMAAIQLRRIISGEWLMIVSGVASILFGVLLVVIPGAGALGLVWLIGVSAITYGLLLLLLAFRLRGLAPEVETETTTASRTPRQAAL